MIWPLIKWPKKDDVMPDSENIFTVPQNMIVTSGTVLFHTYSSSSSSPFYHECKPLGGISELMICQVDLTEGVKRDLNCLFKFNVGDRVKKRWNWMKKLRSRFYIHERQGQRQGTIHKIYPEHGEICIRFDGGTFLHFGASELDLLPDPNATEESESDEKEESNA